MGRRALNWGRDGNEHPAKQFSCRASPGFGGGHPERWGCGWPGNAHCQPKVCGNLVPLSKPAFLSWQVWKAAEHSSTL